MRFQLPCLPDTGANYTLIDAKAAQENGLLIEEADNYTVEGAGKNLLPVTGISPVTFQLDTQKVSTTAIIVKGLSYKVLLGCFQSQILGIIPLVGLFLIFAIGSIQVCLLYTSDAADE